MTDDRTPEEELANRQSRLEDELRRVQETMDEEDRFEAPPITDDMDARLQALEKRAKQAKGEAIQKKDFVYREQRGAKYYDDSGKGLSTGMVAAGAIIGGPVAGYLLGMLMDHYTGSNAWKPLIMILGAAAGIAFTVKYVNARNGD